MIFRKHSSLKSNKFFNAIFIPCFSGSRLFKAQVFRVWVFQDPGFSGFRSRICNQGPGPDFRSCQILTIAGFKLKLGTVYRHYFLRAIQSVLSISMKSPIKKLLVSINQSSSGNMIYFYQKFFDRAKEANIYAIKSRNLRLQLLNFLYFCSFVFKENHVFNYEENPPQRVVIQLRNSQMMLILITLEI